MGIMEKQGIARTMALVVEVMESWEGKNAADIPLPYVPPRITADNPAFPSRTSQKNPLT